MHFMHFDTASFLCGLLSGPLLVIVVAMAMALALALYGGSDGD